MAQNNFHGHDLFVLFHKLDDYPNVERYVRFEGLNGEQEFKEFHYVKRIEDASIFQYKTSKSELKKLSKLFSINFNNPKTFIKFSHVILYEKFNSDNFDYINLDSISE